MNTTSKLVLAAAAAAALGAAATPAAYAGSNFNGPGLTGLALGSLEAHRPAVTAVSLLPSDGAGEVDASKNGRPEPAPAPKRASDLGGLMVAAGTQKPAPTTNPK